MMAVSGTLPNLTALNVKPPPPTHDRGKGKGKDLRWTWFMQGTYAPAMSLV